MKRAPTWEEISCELPIAHGGHAEFGRQLCTMEMATHLYTGEAMCSTVTPCVPDLVRSAAITMNDAALHFAVPGDGSDRRNKLAALVPYMIGIQIGANCREYSEIGLSERANFLSPEKWDAMFERFSAFLKKHNPEGKERERLAENATKYLHRFYPERMAKVCEKLPDVED